MKQQARQFLFRPIFNRSDRCLFSVSNQIVCFAFFFFLCPQLCKNIFLAPSLTLIHQSTYRGHVEVSVWVFLCGGGVYFVTFPFLRYSVLAFLCPHLQRCQTHIGLNNAGGLKRLQVCSHLPTSVTLSDILILNLWSNQQQEVRKADKLWRITSSHGVEPFERQLVVFHLYTKRPLTVEL